MSYKLDHRQSIADSWPQSIDDHFARRIGVGNTNLI